MLAERRVVLQFESGNNTSMHFPAAILYQAVIRHVTCQSMPEPDAVEPEILRSSSG